VLFSDNGVELDEEGKRQIDHILQKIVGVPQKIEVRGHASRQPKGDISRDPWQLSYQRCLTVMKYLHDQGVEPNRIRLTQAGVHEPFTIRNDANAMARNSRVEVYLLAEMAEDLVGTPEERSQHFQEQTAVPGTSGAE